MALFHDYRLMALLGEVSNPALGITGKRRLDQALTNHTGASLWLRDAERYSMLGIITL